MRIPFLRISTAVLLGFFWITPDVVVASAIACDPVEQRVIIGQTVHIQLSGDTRAYRVDAPGGSVLTQGVPSVAVRYGHEGFFPITVWNDVGDRSVCYVHVHAASVRDEALEASVRSVVADSFVVPPSVSRFAADSPARIVTLIDVALAPLVIFAASITALLFVGYNGSAMFRRRHRLGNIDVVRTKTGKRLK